jgi:hypothetical protein
MQWYQTRSSWSSRSIGDRFLEDANIAVSERGAVFVYVDGELLFEYPNLAAFFGAHSVLLSDLQLRGGMRASMEA